MSLATDKNPINWEWTKEVCFVWFPVTRQTDSLLLNWLNSCHGVRSIDNNLVTCNKPNCKMILNHNTVKIKCTSKTDNGRRALFTPLNWVTVMNWGGLMTKLYTIWNTRFLHLNGSLSKTCHQRLLYIAGKTKI